MTETTHNETHREAGDRELANATDLRAELAAIYKAPKRDYTRIGLLNAGIKYSLAAAAAHYAAAILDAIEHNWQPVTINLASSLDQTAPQLSERIVEELERARRQGARPLVSRSW